MSIFERFEQFDRPDFFSRIDTEHILDLFVGLDNDGRQAIELRAQFEPQKIKSTECIIVGQYQKSNYNILRFSLVNKEVSGLFYKFCEDIIEKTRELKNKNEGYRSLIARYYQWRKLFVPIRNDMLPETLIMGLIGEILFLGNGLRERVGISRALAAWSGQELTHKDFSIDSTWYEVKTISSGASSVKIASLEQLDGEEGVLAVYRLEKMSKTYNGVSLNKLIVYTLEMFDTEMEKDDFLAKVQRQGYTYNDYYDEYVYRITEYSEFKVSDGFPRITRDDVSSAIARANYELLISELQRFKIKEHI